MNAYRLLLASFRSLYSWRPNWAYDRFPLASGTQTHSIDDSRKRPV